MTDGAPTLQGYVLRRPGAADKAFGTFPLLLRFLLKEVPTDVPVKVFAPNGKIALIRGTYPAD